MKKKCALAFVLGGLLASQGAFGIDCGCDRTNAVETILEADSASYGTVKLKFDTPVQTSGIYKGSLCQQNAAQVKKVRLFMPDMGHGSSPTDLAPATAECLRVENINFMMGGLWEIWVYQPDGTSTMLSLAI